MMRWVCWSFNVNIAQQTWRQESNVQHRVINDLTVTTNWPNTPLEKNTANNHPMKHGMESGSKHANRQRNNALHRNNATQGYGTIDGRLTITIAGFSCVRLLVDQHEDATKKQTLKKSSTAPVKSSTNGPSPDAYQVGLLYNEKMSAEWLVNINGEKMLWTVSPRHHTQLLPHINPFIHPFHCFFCNVPALMAH